MHGRLGSRCDFPDGPQDRLAWGNVASGDESSPRSDGTNKLGLLRELRESFAHLGWSFASRLHEVCETASEPTARFPWW